ncbi:MAG: hypothetical protein FJ271_10735 [Planctomycetes bacterium]|nr:hypothetical protein [Planctomycetota bacterium]
MTATPKTFTILSLAGFVLIGSDALRAGDKTAPAVTTRSAAAAVGFDKLTVNGSIQPRGRLTTYYFEYGPTAAYGKKTAVRPLPPRLAAYYRESWDDGFGGWASWFKKEHHKAGGDAGGFVRFAEPSNHDHNHDDGIGTVHLTKYLYPGTHPPSVFLGGGDPDFRDARIRISVRGHNWKPNGTELLWWTQSQMELPIDRKDWVRPNWAYTGYLLTDFLADGKWHKVDYRLRNDASDWSYTGGKRGYKYGSIDFCQEHLNIDCFHMVTFVDTKNPPQGAIDFDELTIAYRNKSLLFPANGGKLESAPGGGDDPARLTDGWRHGKDHAWRSAAKPAAPLEFVYRFARPVRIEAVQLHQNPDWPAKDVAVLTSTDGKDYKPLVTKVLPAKHEHGPNWLFSIDRGLSAKAGWLKVIVKSGYRAEHWGLGEIEVFGTGADMLPDDDLYYVNTDLSGLEKGKRYHYRLVAVQDGKTFAGEDRIQTMPADGKPVCATGPAGRITATSAKLDGRVNPLGDSASFYFEYGPDTSYGMKTATGYAGQQLAGRLVFASVAGLSPATTYHYRLVAVNKNGTTSGEDRTFVTPKK